MSDTSLDKANSVAASQSSKPGAEPIWAKPSVAIFTLAIYLALIVVTIVIDDHQTFAMLAGIGAGMAGAAVNYYLGSSSGSTKKTDLLAVAPPVIPEKDKQP